MNNLLVNWILNSFKILWFIISVNLDMFARNHQVLTEDNVYWHSPYEIIRRLWHIILWVTSVNVYDTTDRFWCILQPLSKLQQSAVTVIIGKGYCTGKAASLSYSHFWEWYKRNCSTAITLIWLTYSLIYHWKVVHVFCVLSCDIAYIMCYPEFWF